MVNRSTFWTLEREKELRQLVEEKSRTREISEAMFCTRNMIIGKMRRMGLSFKKDKKPKPSKPRMLRKLTAEEVAARRKPKPMKEIIKGDDIPPLLDSIKRLRRHDGALITCAYPYGDREFKFCGRKVERGSFCALHASLCYQPPRPNTRPYAGRRHYA